MERKRRFPINLYNRLEEKLKSKSDNDGMEAAKDDAPAAEERRIKCPKCGDRKSVV